MCIFSFYLWSCEEQGHYHLYCLGNGELTWLVQDQTASESIWNLSSGIWCQRLEPLPRLDSPKVAFRFALGNTKANRSGWLCGGTIPGISWNDPAAERACPGSQDTWGYPSHLAEERHLFLRCSDRGGHLALFLHVCQFYFLSLPVNWFFRGPWIPPYKCIQQHREPRGALAGLTVEFHPC